MVVNRSKSPSAQETFMQMAQAAGLRSRLLVTIGMLVLIRLGMYIPLPGIDRSVLETLARSSNTLGFLNTFAGGGFTLLGVFALGILPFINASIIMQILAAALPSLENLQKNEGEAGRRKISQYTRYVALFFAVLQGIGISLFLININATTIPDPGFQFIFETAIALVAGSMFVMWAGELITERGVGNGASLLIFINIVAVLPSSLGDTISLTQQDSAMLGGVLLLLVIFLAMIVGIVFVQEGERRIQIIYARRQVGRKMYREQSSYLPLKLNQGGVMPIIFASSVFFLPAILSDVFSSVAMQRVSSFLTPGSWGYVVTYLVLILAFSYFYSSIVLDPVDLSQNLKKMGASIPGVRPGTATSTYISSVLNRLIFLGAIFLGAVAIIPTAFEQATGVTTFQGIGATSLLIIVGVAIETARQIQTYVISQRYEGMVKQ
ncbi:protein translocase subunit secY/sec61 alpha [Thalassoporum mexicanum PCC 7367]|uniref:preprotein translocase subunit SecY n=1 Tax=Thalassoporum mexicanum TaxID=3457544 RepID=UPI00029FD0E3|nr:preprotein translocase subunit SecY [Pseudanabaena sp. PCC 7367]AFY69394.1 protein translocase subunit secY/sec61 alpha [Pseudanabaena sp. PCC 7367]